MGRWGGGLAPGGWAVNFIYGANSGTGTEFPASDCLLVFKGLLWREIGACPEFTRLGGGLAPGGWAVNFIYRANGFRSTGFRASG
jgi:hypothetical protein